MKTKNLFQLPTPLPWQEQTTILSEANGIRIEQIISTGQVTDWYSQSENEFVSLLLGTATLEWEDGTFTHLNAGDTLTILPYKRHRVSATSSNPPCVWLCVFWDER